MSGKSEVYSWRLSPATKSRLEEAARRERRSVADLLEEIVAGHLGAREREAAVDADRQRQLHRVAGRFAGCLDGGHPDRSARVRQLVRARLAARRRGR